VTEGLLVYPASKMDQKRKAIGETIGTLLLFGELFGWWVCLWKILEESGEKRAA